MSSSNKHLISTVASGPAVGSFGSFLENQLQPKLPQRVPIYLQRCLSSWTVLVSSEDSDCREAIQIWTLALQRTQQTSYI